MTTIMRMRGRKSYHLLRPKQDTALAGQMQWDAKNRTRMQTDGFGFSRMHSCRRPPGLWRCVTNAAKPRRQNTLAADAQIFSESNSCRRPPGLWRCVTNATKPRR